MFQIGACTIGCTNHVCVLPSRLRCVSRSASGDTANAIGRARRLYLARG